MWAAGSAAATWRALNLRLHRAAGVLEPEDLALANQLLRTPGSP